MPRQITVDELARMLAAGEPVLLLDVRQPWEHETARLPHSLLVPLSELTEAGFDDHRAAVTPPAGTLVVAYCHHGIRSLDAAGLLEAHGIESVVSLAGGIDAWSRKIDPSVPRY